MTAPGRTTYHVEGCGGCIAYAIGSVLLAFILMGCMLAAFSVVFG